MDRLVLLVVGVREEHRDSLSKRYDAVGLRIDDRLDVLEPAGAPSCPSCRASGSQARDAGEGLVHMSTPPSTTPAEAEARPQRLDVADLISSWPRPNLGGLVGVQLVVGAACAEGGEDFSAASIPVLMAL